MNEILGRIICAMLFLIVVVGIFIYSNNIYSNKRNISENLDLVIYGENIDSGNKAFLDENNGIYIPFNTIYKVIDENIYYDKVSTKVIVTKQDKVIKMKLNDSTMYVNSEPKPIDTPVKLKDERVYVDIKLLADVYNISVDFNKDKNVVTIDKNEEEKSEVKYNNVNVYADITTKSNVINRLSYNDKVVVYNSSLNHKRWFKIKTQDGTVGYISKNNVILEEVLDGDKKEENNYNMTQNKYIMFWQYGSDVKTLGEKTEGVNVVLPTWYEISNANGSIISKYSQTYYNKAKQYGYEIWPTVSNGFDSANYNPDDTSNLLNSDESREKIILNLLKKCKEDKVDGINIDFESMNTSDRDLFTQFIREMVPYFRNEKIKVSVDTYFVEYLDRKAIGASVDYMILMGYDQRGNWSSIAGSIAEVDWTRKNIESLINDSDIPSNKIILGIPFYSRLWIEKKGEDKPTTKAYTMQDCLDFVDYYNLTLTYDETSGQNYVEYTKGNLTYKLWLEDETSVKNRVNIVNEYDLSGICAWRRGFETDNIWNVIKDNINN